MAATTFSKGSFRFRVLSFPGFRENSCFSAASFLIESANVRLTCLNLSGRAAQSRAEYSRMPTRQSFFPPHRRFSESAASSQPVLRQSGSAMQTCRFISSVNSTFMGSFLLSPDDDIEEEALCLFEAADLILRQRTRPHVGELVQLLGGFTHRHPPH